MMCLGTLDLKAVDIQVEMSGRHGREVTAGSSRNIPVDNKAVGLGRFTREESMELENVQERTLERPAFKDKGGTSMEGSPGRAASASKGPGQFCRKLERKEAENL